MADLHLASAEGVIMRGQALDPLRALERVIAGLLAEVLGNYDILVGGPKEDVDGRSG